MNLLVNADARHIPLKPQSVHCIVTSPPYFGLRDYGTADWVGGDPECEHKYQLSMPGPNSDVGHRTAHDYHHPYKDICKDCGAIRIDKQIGLEPTPDDFVQAMVAVGRELWRVLRDDGTWWLNLGDSYAGSGKGGQSEEMRSENWQPKYGNGGMTYNLKPKDLIGIPWRVALALQTDGWYLRQDIIWHKPNPMPESVKDRCTKAHEYIFLLTKSARYYYDNEAVKEPQQESSRERLLRGWNGNGERGYPNGPQNHLKNYMGSFDSIEDTPSGRNRRSVWTVTTKPYPGSHYATFPPDLIEPCILAGTSAKGVCPKCGAPWERVTETESHYTKRQDRDQPAHKDPQVDSSGWEPPTVRQIGWQPTCECGIEETVPATVLDPFVGSGTTLMVARKHRRHGIGIDLNYKYLNTNARERLVYGGFVPVADGVQQLTLDTGGVRGYNG